MYLRWDVFQFGMLLSGETVLLHVKEKKKWKKYPCCLRDNQFVQFKDPKVCMQFRYLGGGGGTPMRS